MKKKHTIGFLFFLLPMFFFLFISFSRESDIWFLLSHGKYVLEHGFPHMEFLTMHTGLHFVMQQWLFSCVCYFFYHIAGSLGIILMVGILNVFLVLFLYKQCLQLCHNSYTACLVAALIDVLLELNFIVPRPQMISLLFLLIVVFLLEKGDKSIYGIPILSFFLIQFHASMWPMLFILFFPFLLEEVLHKNKRVYSLLGVFILSFLVGFLNPYGIEAMTYTFHSYGIKTINLLIDEMQHFSFVGDSVVVFNSVLFFFLMIIFLYSIIRNKENYSIHSICLFLGISFMTFLNLRNLSLFFVIVMPYSCFLLKKEVTGEIYDKYYLIGVLMFLLLFGIFYQKGFYTFQNDEMEHVVHFLEQQNYEEVLFFNDFNDGAYLEYAGYPAYIDSRAEVFLKKMNHKEDILEEYYQVLTGEINYSDFIQKYHFQLLIVHQNSAFYHYLDSSHYTIVYQYKDVFVFET